MRKSGARDDHPHRSDQSHQPAGRDLREVYQRTNDRPFTAIDDVISREELIALSDNGYKKIAGYSKDALRA